MLTGKSEDGHPSLLRNMAYIQTTALLKKEIKEWSVVTGYRNDAYDIVLMVKQT